MLSQQLDAHDDVHAASIAKHKKALAQAMKHSGHKELLKEVTSPTVTMGKRLR